MVVNCAWVGYHSRRKCIIIQDHWHYPAWTTRKDDVWIAAMMGLWWPDRRPRAWDWKVR